MTSSNIIFPQVLDADPDDNSLLSAKLNNFVYADITNTTALSLANFQDILSSIVTDRGSSALWFYPAAVMTCFIF